jgi:S1-C subfamily serine protease
VNLLDVFLVVAGVFAAVGGYRLGFVARVASWVGLAIGVFLAIRFIPSLLEQVQGTDPAIRFLLSLSALLVGAILGGAIGQVAGYRLRSLLPIGSGLRSLDRTAGGAGGLLSIVAAVWLLLPAMSDVPGPVARQARNSAIADAVATYAPAPPNALDTLRRLVGGSDFPQVFDALRPAPNTGVPPEATELSDEVVARVAASTVRVQGEACGRIQNGSGFAVEPELVVTNAHVVAGVQEPAVERPDGQRLPARLVHFDDNRDIALLRVPGLGQAPLSVAAADVGEAAAVFGHPGGQIDVRVAPATISDRQIAVGRDLYNNERTRREIFFLAARLQPGDSGAALVDVDGAVVGVAFAIAPDRSSTAYALTEAELNAALQGARGPSDPGPCLT